MLCSVVTCFELLHVVQCCYVLFELLHDVLYRVITWCAVLFHVAKGYYMLRNVVTRGIVLLNFVQQCYML